MIYFNFLPALACIFILTACGPKPAPKIQAGEVFAKSRVVLVKGRVGGLHSADPYLQRRTYTVTCARGNKGGTPAQRADAMMAILPRTVGQVDVAISPGDTRSFDMKKINSLAVPNYRCSVDNTQLSVEGSGNTAILRWAIENNALQELIDER